MYRSITCMHSLNLAFIFFEVDQAVYNMVSIALFSHKLNGKKNYENIVIRMGGFHVIICMIKKIYSRFKIQTKLKILFEARVGIKVTVRAAKKGADDKKCITYFKIIV